MLAAIPAPGALAGALRANTGSSNNGYWVLTDDPALITQAGDRVVRGDSIKEVEIGLNTHFGTPAKCTRFEVVSCHHWKSDRNYDQLKLTLDRVLDAETGKKLDTEEKKNPHGYSYGSLRWNAFRIAEGPIFSLDEKEKDLPTELDLLTAAMKCGTDGLVFSHSDARKVFPDGWKPSDNKKAKIIDDKFLVEPLARNRYRLVYNPNRVKNLKKRRAKSGKATDKNAPWLKYTCYQLLCKIVSEYRQVCALSCITNIFGWGNYSTHGIDDCMRTIGEFHDVAKALNKVGVVRRRIKKLMKLLSYHQAQLERKSAWGFMYWYNRELKAAGGAPKEAKDRYQHLKKNTEKVKRKKTIEKIMNSVKKDKLL